MLFARFSTVGVVATWLALLLGCGFAFPAAAIDDKKVGSAAAISGSVTGNVGGRSRGLSTGVAVYGDERISAASASTGQFVLLDSTKIAVGPGATIVLDAFLVSSGGAARKVSLKALKGALRFGTGRSAKSAYRVNTPTASLGFRGTLVDIYVGGGRTSVLLLRGGLRVCGRAACRDLNANCSWATINSNGSISSGTGLGGINPAGVSNAVAFPFARNDNGLIGGLRANGPACFAQANNPGRQGEAPSRDSAPARGGTTGSTNSGSQGSPPSGSPPGNPGNPGNDKAVGRAGEAPGRSGGNFGGGTRGRSDAPGHGGGGGGGAGAGGSTR